MKRPTNAQGDDKADGIDGDIIVSFKYTNKPLCHSKSGLALDKLSDRKFARARKQCCFPFVGRRVLISHDLS